MFVAYPAEAETSEWFEKDLKSVRSFFADELAWHVFIDPDSDDVNNKDLTR